MEILNYKEIGEGLIRETIGFNQDKYEYVNIESYSDETILNIAKEFIDKHPEQCVDYIKWCFALKDDCDKVTYDTMFDLVEIYTLQENVDFYWNAYKEAFTPCGPLNDMYEALENEPNNILEPNNTLVIGYEDDCYLHAYFGNNEYKIFNDDLHYFVQIDNNQPSEFDNIEDTIDYLYKIQDEELYFERKRKRLLSNYKEVGERILTYYPEDFEMDCTIRWVKGCDLSEKTIQYIGIDFVNSDKDIVKEWSDFIIGRTGYYEMYEDYMKTLEPIIKKHVLTLESEKYYWSDKYNQIVPRSAISEIENFLSKNKLEFKHKVDNNGEHTEIYLTENEIAKIDANRCSNNNWTYDLELIDKDSLCYSHDSTKEEIVNFILNYKNKLHYPSLK